MSLNEVVGLFIIFGGEIMYFNSRPKYFIRPALSPLAWLV